MAEVQERPHKKRRFFVEDSPESAPSLPNGSSLPENVESAQSEDVATVEGDVFDAGTFRAFVGEEVQEYAGHSLQRRFGTNIEAAINAYFDGSWKTPSPQKPNAVAQPAEQRPIPFRRETSHSKSLPNGTSFKSSPPPPPKPPALDSMPKRRYIGALGVAGWTTRSGTGLLKPNDVVKIERTKHQSQKVGRGGKIIVGLALTRLTNS